MMRSLAAIGVLTLGMACDGVTPSSSAGTGDGVATAPPPGAKGADVKLTISQGEIRWNGEVLPLGVPLSQWVQVLGAPDREDIGAVFWDSLGIMPLMKIGPPEESMVYGLRVLLRDQQRPLDPRTVFAGDLRVDGVPVNENLTRETLVKTLVTPCEWPEEPSPQPFRSWDLSFAIECRTVNPPLNYGIVFTRDPGPAYPVELTVALWLESVY